MNQYAIINILGLAMAILLCLFSILAAKRKLKPKVIRIIWTFFGIAVISYGAYILSVKEIVGRLYSQKSYSIGGWVTISIGIIFLLVGLFGSRKDKNTKKS
jgi:ABC-type transport system involved in cytochrome c biogenesis permease subunit